MSFPLQPLDIPGQIRGGYGGNSSQHHLLADGQSVYLQLQDDSSWLSSHYCSLGSAFLDSLENECPEPDGGGGKIPGIKYTEDAYYRNPFRRRYYLLRRFHVRANRLGRSFGSSYVPHGFRK